MPFRNCGGCFSFLRCELPPFSSKDELLKADPRIFTGSLARRKEGHQYKDDILDRINKISASLGLDSAMRDYEMRYLFRTCTHHILGTTKCEMLKGISIEKSIRCRCSGLGRGNGKSGLEAAIAEESRYDNALKQIFRYLHENMISNKLQRSLDASATVFPDAFKYGENANYLEGERYVTT